MGITELAILKWMHIVAMVYWLGGEWGVFQTSYNVINRQLSMEERRRHMETVYRIDILARTGIILLLPLGLHMGYLWGAHTYGGVYLAVMWILLLIWLGLAWAAFVNRETDTGIRLTIYDERIRFVLIPAMILACVTSLFGYGPFNEAYHWFIAKLFIYSLLLVIGLKLRFIMREWTMLFRILAEGENREAEQTLERSIATGRMLAYFYWIGIGTVAFLGVTKLSF